MDGRDERTCVDGFDPRRQIGDGADFTAAWGGGEAPQLAVEGYSSEHGGLVLPRDVESSARQVAIREAARSGGWNRAVMSVVPNELYIAIGPTRALLWNRQARFIPF